MIRYLLVLPYLALCLTAFGQSKSSLDFTFGGWMTNHHYQADHPIINKVYGDELSMPGWKIGLHFNQVLTSGFSTLIFRTGLDVFTMGYTTPQEAAIFYGDPLDPSFETGDVFWSLGVLDFRKITYRHMLVGVPLHLRLEFGRQALSPYIEFGLTPAYYLGSTSRYVSEIGTSAHAYRINSSALNEFRFFADAAIGLNYKVTNRWQLFAQPIFSWQLNSSLNSRIAEHLFGLGLDAGVRMVMQ